MLTNTLRVLIYELFLEKIYSKNDKILINIVDSFLNFSLRGVKNFLL